MATTRSRDEARAPVVSQFELPPSARARGTLSRIDYEDAFLLETDSAGRRTGEQWARAMLQDAPMIMQRQLQLGWLAIGLKLDGTRSDRFVLGWEVRRSTADFTLLGCSSRVGLPAELLFESRPDALLFATFVQHGNPVARAMWATIAPQHRRIVTHLLTQAGVRHTRDVHSAAPAHATDGSTLRVRVRARRRRLLTVQQRRGVPRFAGPPNGCTSRPQVGSRTCVSG